MGVYCFLREPPCLHLYSRRMLAAPTTAVVFLKMMVGLSTHNSVIHIFMEKWSAETCVHCWSQGAKIIVINLLRTGTTRLPGRGGFPSQRNAGCAPIP